MYLDPCPKNPSFQIHASAKGAYFTIQVTSLPPPNLEALNEIGCVQQDASPVSYHDDSWSLFPFSPYGAIAFLNAQMVGYIHVQNVTAQ